MESLGMQSFIPQLVLIHREALKYPLGRFLKEQFQSRGLETVIFEKRVPGSKQGSFEEKFRFAKRTVVVGIWTGRDFQTCRPSAHYQLPLFSGCPGMCHYCYLNTNLGKRPVVKVNVNLEDIFAQAKKYVQERLPDNTIFEGAATSDPVALENLTGSLREAIKFFAVEEKAQFRFVTKYTAVDGLLDIKHNEKTEVRFSINCDYVIRTFEKGVPRLARRLEAAGKVMLAGYPVGFLVGPIFVFDGWRKEYTNMFGQLKEQVSRDFPLTFELVSHRFTSRAKEIIRTVYPDTDVPLDEEGRKFKFGQFGYGKYVYPEEVMRELKEFFENQISTIFPKARVLYFV